jgi:hypothetical protein
MSSRCKLTALGSYLTKKVNKLEELTMEPFLKGKAQYS